MIDFEVVAFEVNCFPTAPRIENQIFFAKNVNHLYER